MVCLVRNVCAALCAVCLVGAAEAQRFPSKPITIYVPLTRGSGADAASRILATHLSAAFRQPVTVENRPGAGGQVGAQEVLDAAPDGYTLLVRSASHAVNAVLYRNLPYDTLRDFADVALLGVTPYLIVTAQGGPYRKLGELIEAARARPGVITFASAGVGTSTHLAAEYFAQVAGVSMLHVAYKGSPEALQDVAARRVAIYMAPANAAVEAIRAGRLAALAVSTRQRTAALPDVAPLAEQGLPQFDLSLWYGMWAAARTPPEAIRTLNAQVNAIVRRDDVRRQFEALGLVPRPMESAEFARFVRTEIANYRRIVALAGVQPQ